MSKLVRGAAALGLFAWASCLGAEEPKVTFSNGGEHRGVIEANGLRFVIMPDPSTQLAEVDVRYDVGAREDPQGKAGLAHLVEHLMFQTRPDGPNTAPMFQTIIALATDFNAYTNWDTTHYRMTSQAGNLDAMLKIEVAYEKNAKSQFDAIKVGDQITIEGECGIFLIDSLFIGWAKVVP